MAVVTLARPTSISTGNIVGGSLIGAGGTSYYIKVRRYRLKVSTPVAEVTGDKDGGPHFLSNYFAYADLSLIGFMVAAQAIGLDSIVSTSLNPTASGTDISLALDSTREFNGRYVVESFTVDWDRIAPYVGIAMVLKATVLSTGLTALSETTY